MKPLTYCLENALEILPDAQRRILTDEARRFAEEGREPRDIDSFGAPVNYWSGVVSEHKLILWLDAYEKRKARLQRLAGRT